MLRRRYRAFHRVKSSNQFQDSDSSSWLKKDIINPEKHKYWFHNTTIEAHRIFCGTNMTTQILILKVITGSAGPNYLVGSMEDAK